MRPKKKILLIDSEEVRRIERAFILETAGREVTCAGSREAALRELQATEFDAVICALRVEAEWAEELAREIALGRGLPCLLIADNTLRLGEMTYQDTAAELLEHIRVMVARKPGRVSESERQRRAKSSAHFWAGKTRAA